MANYTPITNFSVKDTLPAGDTLKRAKGADIQAELNAIAAALLTKVDNDGDQTVNNNVTFTSANIDCGTY